jgi:signal transduction histidine kinase
MTIRPGDIPTLLPEPDIAGEDAREFYSDRIGFLVRRIHEKIDSYEEYQFSEEESRCLNIFFDLAQEYETVEDLYVLSVTIPRVFFNKHAVLYALTEEKQMVECCSTAWEEAGDDAVQGVGPLYHVPTLENGRFYVPIRGNHQLIEQLPFEPEEDIIGMLEIFPAEALTPHESLFFEKYANRVGFQLHNRILAAKSQEHLAFIKNLVNDIGHNVIVPNMYFKLYYRRLESRIKVLKDITQEFAGLTRACDDLLDEGAGRCRRFQRELEYTYEVLMEQFQEIYSHYEQTSLFLETLLRRQHFEQGHYVLEKRPCRVKSQVVDPQLERYRARLEDRGVDIVYPDISEEEPEIQADLGLMSQVIANFISNGVKYTREVTDERGNWQKFITYGWERIPDHFGPGNDGVKVIIFTTGPHVPQDEQQHLYGEKFRGRNAKGEYGTGHGLLFVREVVGLHGGYPGYEPKPLGNNFFVIMPTQPPE